MGEIRPTNRRLRGANGSLIDINPVILCGLVFRTADGVPHSSV